MRDEVWRRGRERESQTPVESVFTGRTWMRRRRLCGIEQEEEAAAAAEAEEEEFV